MKKIILIILAILGAVSMSYANLTVDLGNSVKTGTYYTFPSLSVTGNTGDKGYVIRFMFTRPVIAGDAITLPAMPSGWSENANSNEYVRIIDIPAGAIPDDMQTFLRLVQVTFAATKNGHEVVVLISENSSDTNRHVYYSSDTEHWYEYVESLLITWVNSYNDALDRTFMGLTGYLANITSDVENDFINSIATGKNGWFSGTRYDVRTVMQPDGKLSGVPTAEMNYWYWSCGPEWDETKTVSYPDGNPADAVFYDKTTRSSSPAPVTVKYNYAPWHYLNPSNSGSGEYCIQALGDEGGVWNDWPNYFSSITGYIVEYRGFISAANSTGLVGFGSVKNASIAGVQNNGTATNPVLLYLNDVITYTVTVANISITNTLVTVRDTVPEGLQVISGSITSGGVFDNVSREIVWNLTIPTEDETTVSYQVGKNIQASNLMNNTAYIICDGNVVKRTNTTHHQGAVRNSDYPDNISDADCYVDPPATVWGIKNDWRSSQTNISEFIIPFVGDLDGDEIPEIVCFNTAGRLSPITSNTNATAAQTIVIYDGQTKALKNTITLPSHVTEYDGAAYGLFRRPSDGKGLIVVATLDYKLRAYDITGTLMWTSDVDYGSQMGDFAVNTGFVDFNMDGSPEVYVRDKIYNASTGKLLAEVSPASNTGSSWAHWTHNATHWRLSSPLAADVIGDSKPELILGNEIYSVTITPNSNDMSGNSINLLRTAALPSGVTTSDGHAQVADFNMDGHLDILITNRDTYANNGGTVTAYIWDVFNNRTSAPLIINTTWSGKNIPLIADVNNNGKLDIVIQCDFANTDDDTRAYEYDAGTDAFNLLWSIDPDEDSYSNSMTLFDFNQDGMNEVLITDQKQVRIFNGSGKSHITHADTIPVYQMAVFNFSETTIMQYPVIADVDNDGGAEIVACGGSTLNIFKAINSESRWAPARKVWNQYMYNSVNVNEDLTIPQYQLNPATVFPGGDGQSGSADDVRPYNNFLQQQTALSKNGVPLWLTPYARTVGSPELQYNAATDILTVTVKVQNAGDAVFGAPFKITAYKNVLGGSPKYTYSYPNAIAVGEIAEISFNIQGFKANWGNFSNIVIRVNDNGNTYNDQMVCDSSYRDTNTGSLAASDDNAMVFKNSMDNRIIVAINDLLPCALAGANVSITADGSPQHGTVSRIHDTIIYTPFTDYLGGDTVIYRIYCDDPTKADTAKIYIKVLEKPDNVNYDDCYVTPPATAWGITIDWSSPGIVSNHIIPLVGDLNNDNIPEIVCFGTAGEITSPQPFKAKTVLVYDGKTHDLVRTITLPQIVSAWEGAPYGLVKIPENNTGLIVVADYDCKLRAYDITGTQMWVSDVDYGLPANKDYAVSVAFADFNGDGSPEVCVRNMIYSASSGKLLATTAGGSNTGSAWAHHAHTAGHKLSSPIVADVIGDARPELILGNEIYTVTITNTAGTTGNSAEMTKSITPPAGVTVTDGHAQVADFNNDGHPDILISNRSTSADANGTVAVYIWDVRNNTVSQALVIPVTGTGKSIPLIADVNNNKKLDIVIQCKVSTTDRIRAYEYDATTETFSLLWGVVPDEDSYSNGATLFDFNLDGYNEVLISDQSRVRIFNGSNVSTPMGTLNFSETTIMQYPVIADVDNDGSADIVVCGNNKLHILKSSGSPWAPARKVWNQYMYNALNINEDLTVPAVMFNPATVFPGNDGQLGTVDDVRPYNNFLQQQTALNKSGTPLWLAPDVKFAETPVFNYYGDGDSLVIITKPTNIGDAVLSAPFYISTYKNSATVATNKMSTDSSMVALSAYAADTLTVTLTIRDFASYKSSPDLTDIVVRINDKGDAEYVQQECEYDNNVYTADFLPLNYIVTTSCELMPDTIDVPATSIIPSGCMSPAVNIVSHPAHITATVDANNRIIFNSSLSGVDTVTYSITCGGTTRTSEIYITVIPSSSAFVDDIWYYGMNGEGIRFTDNGGIYTAQDASGESKVQSHENSLAVSSPYCDGQDIFYANHNKLYNSLHEPMTKGNFMGHSSVADGLAACYMGNNKYLFFSVTNSYETGNRGLKAYLVDMTADHGRGEITDSAVIEAASADMSESVELVAADVPHKYWLIYAYKNGTHHELRVRPVDVSQPIASAVGTVAHTAVTSTSLTHHTYTLKASPQHNRIAIANSDDETVDVFDFDNITGKLDKRRTTPSAHKIDGIAYGVEFSPDGDQLYAAGYTTNGGTPLLCQYTITSSALTHVSSIQYWTYTGNDGHSRGGGLKLGPDGQIYVILSYDRHVGIISNPNATTPGLSLRYATGMELEIKPSSYSSQFSTGLTRPSEMECNDNNKPVAHPDNTTFCVNTLSRTVTKNVLKNDTDEDGNTVYLTGAEFINASDAALAEITVKSADSISLTVKPGAYISVNGHDFKIMYHVRDNGAPASQCATGLLTITALPTPSYPDIRVRVCPGVNTVNLSKYIDTVIDISTVQWGGIMSSAISSSGEISINSLSQMRVHTFTYTVTSYCGDEQTRKLYLEMLQNRRTLLPRDTVVICYKYAEAIHIDQLLGIAGGTLSYPASPHIAMSSGGATVMNGKALYEDGHTDSYRGKNDVKTVTFIYTPNSSACLPNTEYKITIVLTDAI